MGLLRDLDTVTPAPRLVYHVLWERATDAPVHRGPSMDEAFTPVLTVKKGVVEGTSVTTVMTWLRDDAARRLYPVTVS